MAYATQLQMPWFFPFKSIESLTVSHSQRPLSLSFFGVLKSFRRIQLFFGWTVICCLLFRFHSSFFSSYSFLLCDFQAIHIFSHLTSKHEPIAQYVCIIISSWCKIRALFTTFHKKWKRKDIVDIVAGALVGWRARVKREWHIHRDRERKERTGNNTCKQTNEQRKINGNDLAARNILNNKRNIIKIINSFICTNSNRFI